MMFKIIFLTRNGEVVETIKYDNKTMDLRELYRKIDEIVKKYPAIDRYEVWERSFVMKVIRENGKVRYEEEKLKREADRNE